MGLREWVNKQTDRMAARAAVAVALGVTEVAVRHWCNGTRQVSGERCIELETFTGGAVTRYALRPDVFGDLSDARPKRKKKVRVI